jgi:murein DD-endopeptidase MepM/ murein hydrolase activator NlpD
MNWEKSFNKGDLNEMEDHLIEEIDYLVKQENLSEEEAFHKAVEEIGKRKELSEAVTIIKKEKNIKKRWRFGLSLVLLFMIIGVSVYLYKRSSPYENEVARNLPNTNLHLEETKNKNNSSKLNETEFNNDLPSVETKTDEDTVDINSQTLSNVLHNRLPDGFPCPGPIDAGFGFRIHPIFKTMDYHTGTDIMLPYGTDLYATGDGIVTGSGWAGGYGYMVTIKHIYSITTRYAHCSKILVKEGDSVKQGQIIAKAGATGTATASHVHYEILLDEKPVDPEEFNNKLIKNYYAMIKNDFMNKR